MAYLSVIPEIKSDTTLSLEKALSKSLRKYFLGFLIHLLEVLFRKPPYSR